MIYLSKLQVLHSFEANIGKAPKAPPLGAPKEAQKISRIQKDTDAGQRGPTKTTHPTMAAAAHSEKKSSKQGASHASDEQTRQHD